MNTRRIKNKKRKKKIDKLQRANHGLEKQSLSSKRKRINKFANLEERKKSYPKSFGNNSAKPYQNQIWYLNQINKSSVCPDGYYFRTSDKKQKYHR